MHTMLGPFENTDPNLLGDDNEAFRGHSLGSHPDAAAAADAHAGAV